MLHQKKSLCDLQHEYKMLGGSIDMDTQVQKRMIAHLYNPYLWF